MGALIFISEILPGAFLISLMVGLLLKNRKWKLVSLGILAAYIIIDIVYAFSGSGSVTEKLIHVLGGGLWAMFVMGVPVLVIFGIPFSLVLVFIKKNNKIAFVALGLALFALVWYLLMGYWLSVM